MPDTADSGFSLLEGPVLPERYALRRRIATGGMASVWCAHDRALGRSVAIKLISPSFASDEAAVRRFKREARASARLSSHRHVVTIYDVGEAFDRGARLGLPFIVMEYLAGGTVADALRVGAVTQRDAVQWLRQAAAAVDYAHSRGVIHRDIKPVNLLLDCDRLVHVADFGIAQLATEATFSGSGQLLGTAAYIAPEQVLGKPAMQASDRYALAVAAFELLVGRRPFTAQNFAAQARQHLEDQPPAASRVNPALPRALDDALTRGMAKRPEDRWSTAAELAEAIASALLAPTTERAIAPRATRAPAPAVHRPRARSRPAHRRAHSRRTPAFAALAAATLAVGVAAAASGTGDTDHGGRQASASTAGTRPGARTSHRHPRRHRTGTSRAKATTTNSTVQASPAAATTPPPTADMLQAHGHQLLEQGDYTAAIPVLRQAVSAAAPDSLTYAYALFDLGRSLRLDGDPKAAVTVLWKRLQIPNQTGVVRAELQLALQALGAKAQHSSGD